MITATPFLAAAADAKLEDWGPLDEATGEPMHTSGTTVWSGEGAQEAGVWECTPGPSRAARRAETLPLSPTSASGAPRGAKHRASVTTAPSIPYSGQLVAAVR